MSTNISLCESDYEDTFDDNEEAFKFNRTEAEEQALALNTKVSKELCRTVQLHSISFSWDGTNCDRVCGNQQ